MQKILQDADLGANLRKLRISRKLTQDEVCAKMAILGRPMGRSNYSHIESGLRNIFVSDLIALKLVFHCSFDDIFDGIVPLIKNED